MLIEATTEKNKTVKGLKAEGKLAEAEAAMKLPASLSYIFRSNQRTRLVNDLNPFIAATEQRKSTQTRGAGVKELQAIREKEHNLCEVEGTTTTDE